MYTFYFLSWAMFSTLISVYLLDQGYRPSQVSLVVSVSFFASMIAQPFLGKLNDKFNAKSVIIVSFLISILGSLIFLFAHNIWVYTLSYSLVLLLINGANPVLEQIATSGPFPYGKIRIWGTIGFAIGTQLAGLIYDKIAPQAIYLCFIMTMGLAILGVLGTSNQPRPVVMPDEEDLEIGFKVLLKNRSFMLYLILAMIYSGILNTGHTYIPAMLEVRGLSVGLSTSVVSISVICEAPLIYLSYLFMDRVKSKHLLLLSVGCVCFQYLVYALNINLLSIILATLLVKHTTGMLFIMVNMKIVSSLVNRHVLMSALALVQASRSLASILFQAMAGQILNITGYANLCWVLVFFLGGIFVAVFFLELPSGNQEKLFSR